MVGVTRYRKWSKLTKSTSLHGTALAVPSLTLAVLLGLLRLLHFDIKHYDYLPTLERRHTTNITHPQH